MKNLIFKTLLGLMAGMVSLLASAESQQIKVIPFTASTWSQLVDQGPRPMAYLFTTSYCSTCPAAFEQLNQAVRQSHQKAGLAAVMMDVDGEQALHHAHHFEGMTQLYAFEGFEPSIRQAVDPKWPNVTPYIVLIDKKGRIQKTLGTPSKKMLRQWLY